MSLSSCRLVRTDLDSGMSLPADYHLHTPLCRHATGEPVELAAQAARIGLSEIGFSDHNPMPRDDFDNWRMKAADLDYYIESVEKARREFPRTTIRLGLEVDYIPGYEGWIRELAARHSWDYLIGSVHYVTGSWAIDSPHQRSMWTDREPFEVWAAYFERLTLAAESGLFDIIGHTDLCKKFCFYPQQDCSPLFRRFLEAARKHGVAIELNTAGLRKDCREIYPSPGIVQLAAQQGVSITFGSDAHAVGEVGMNLGEAVQLARGCGYREYCRFDRRRRTSVPL